MVSTPEMGAGPGHRFEEEGFELREAGRDLPGSHLFLAFAAEFLKPDHAHGAGGALELMEDALAILKAALSERSGQVRQLFAPVRFEVAHDREKECGPAGGHGVELGGIKKSHGVIIRAGRSRGKSKGWVDQGELFRGIRPIFRGSSQLGAGKLWWASPLGIVKIS